MAHLNYTVGGDSNLVNFKSTARVPIDSLKVHFKPVQEGSGDPSPENVRPITGWTGVEAYESGVDTSSKTTIAVDWTTEAGTVYGGYVDLVNGTLVVDRVHHSFSGSESIVTSVANTRIYDLGASVLSSFFNQGSALSSHYAVETSGGGGWENLTEGHFMIAGGSYVGLYDADGADHLKAYLTAQNANGTPVQVVATLATPITYQLTPTELKTLLSTNNIWSNANDVTEVSYAVHDSAMIRAAKRRMAMNVNWR